MEKPLEQNEAVQEANSMKGWLEKKFPEMNGVFSSDQYHVARKEIESQQVDKVIRQRIEGSRREIVNRITDLIAEHVPQLEHSLVSPDLRHQDVEISNVNSIEIGWDGIPTGFIYNLWVWVDPRANIGRDVVLKSVARAMAEAGGRVVVAKVDDGPVLGPSEVFFTLEKDWEEHRNRQAHTLTVENFIGLPNGQFPVYADGPADGMRLEMSENGILEIEPYPRGDGVVVLEAPNEVSASEFK